MDESAAVSPGPAGTGLRVWQLPAPGTSAGDYVALLSAALKRAGVVVSYPGEGNGLWPRAEDPPDVIHLHWLEFIAHRERGGPRALARTVVRYARVLARLWQFRRQGVAVVWTIHNLRPHEPVWPRLERLSSRAALRLCHRAIAHSQYARARIAETYSRAEKVAVVPHGNYIGAFADAEVTRADARAARGLGDGFVYLAFGQVRPYKRLTMAAEAFSTLPDPGARLVIAGNPVVGEEAERLRVLAARDRRIHLDLREIPDAEVGAIHRAADAAVFAYGKMFSSGALLLALSYGLPAIVPDRSAGSEIGASPAVETFDAESFRDALVRITDGDRSERRLAAEAVARRYPWDRVGAETLDVYRVAIAQARGHRRARG